MQGCEELGNGIQSAPQPMSCMQLKQQHFFLHQLQVQHPRIHPSILEKCIMLQELPHELEEIEYIFVKAKPRLHHLPKHMLKT